MTRRPRSPARRWSHALGTAAAAVYLPQLVPLAATDLLDHGHCLGIYARYFPVLIGFLPGLWTRLRADLGEPYEEWLLVGVALVVTGAVLATTASALRRWRVGGRVGALFAALVSGWFAMGAVALIRA